MPDGTTRKVLNVSRLNNLGWNPKISLDYGLSETIKDLDINFFNGQTL